MGKQSSRIYFNGLDHKEMVIWDGSQYVYHDKAYIWNGSEYELVWQKLKYGLKLLYETNLDIRPSASKNNKYLYFTEGNTDAVIYSITIDDDEPEKEEFYSSDLYRTFNAPVSSQGIGIYYAGDGWLYGTLWYRIIALDEHSISPAWVYDKHDAALDTVSITSQDLSIGETGNSYTATIHSYVTSQARVMSGLWTIGYVGLTHTALDYAEIQSTGWWYSIGRQEGYEYELLPRFISLEGDIFNGGVPTLIVWAYGNGASIGGFYTKAFEVVAPFNLYPVGGSSFFNKGRNWTIPRDNKIAFLSSDLHIWIAEISGTGITFTDTGIETYATFWDVSPDFEYALYNEPNTTSAGYRDNLKIVEISTGDIVGDYDLTDFEIAVSVRTGITFAQFVGEKCFHIGGVTTSGGLLVGFNKLYKWRD